MKLSTYGVFTTGKHDDMATALACLPLSGLPLAGEEVKTEQARAEADRAEAEQRAEEHARKIRQWQADPFTYPYLNW